MKKVNKILEIIKVLNQTIGALHFHNKSNVYLHEPDIRKEDWKFVKECLSRNFVSSVGNYVTEFEDMLKKFTKAKYVIATVNGTSAIHLALVVMGANENDEVILPSLNFVAAANAVRYCNAIQHFVEVEEETAEDTFLNTTHNEPEQAEPEEENPFIFDDEPNQNECA